MLVIELDWLLITAVKTVNIINENYTLRMSHYTCVAILLSTKLQTVFNSIRYFFIFLVERMEKIPSSPTVRDAQGRSM